MEQTCRVDFTNASNEVKEQMYIMAILFYNSKSA